MQAISSESSSSSSSSSSDHHHHRKSSYTYAVLLSVILTVLAPVVLAAAVLYRLEPLEPAELPLHELSQPEMAAPRVDSELLRGAEFIGEGQLFGPEDVVFDPKLQLIYTGCGDGWVHRVAVRGDSAVEKWLNTGGRPLGLALGLNGELIVADGLKGLLKVSREGKVEVMTDEAEGRELKFANGVDVAKDGMVYFSEASYKYGLVDFIWDILEGKPHGSLMSFDPFTRQTEVLVRDLYFPNGVQVSPDQKSVIFCETVMRRCKRYIREGERQGSVEIFVDNLPGLPDNIKYDDEGHYWIGLATSVEPYWKMALRYPLIRKGLAIMMRHRGRLEMEKNAGMLEIDLEGKPIAYYYDPSLTAITGGIKIGNYLYCGSISYAHIIRVDLDKHAAS